MADFNQLQTRGIIDHRVFESPAAERAAVWLVEAARVSAVQQRQPLSDSEIAWLGGWEPGVTGDRLTAAQNIDRRVTRIVRAALENDKRANVPVMKVRPGLTVPLPWELRYEIVFMTNWPVRISVIMQNVFFGSPLLGERGPWRSTGGRIAIEKDYIALVPAYVALVSMPAPEWNGDEGTDLGELANTGIQETSDDKDKQPNGQLDDDDDDYNEDRDRFASPEELEAVAAEGRRDAKEFKRLKKFLKDSYVKLPLKRETNGLGADQWRFDFAQVTTSSATLGVLDGMWLLAWTTGNISFQRMMFLVGRKGDSELDILDQSLDALRAVVEELKGDESVEADAFRDLVADFGDRLSRFSDAWVSGLRVAVERTARMERRLARETRAAQGYQEPGQITDSQGTQGT